MQIEKRKIVDLPMVYVTAQLQLGGKQYLAVASEAPGEHAYIIDPETGRYADLWKGDTGVMNIVQIPGTEKLLVIVRFYPIFQSREAAVCLLEPGKDGYMGQWNIREVAKVPFCHRIGVVSNPHGKFLLACQLCADKDFQEDWSKPGSLWTAPIRDDGVGQWELTELFGGLTKNHGLHIENDNQVYICAENGVMYFDLSDYAGGAVQPVLLTTTPSSDISLHCRDGRTFAGVIEPFHGDTLAVYEQELGSWNPLARYDISFGHVVWMGELFGKDAVIAGSRGGEKQLEVISPENEQRIVLDRDVGSTQITVYRQGDVVRILSANHGAGEVAVYTLRQ